jgi:hypothetical protein
MATETEEWARRTATLLDQLHEHYEHIGVAIETYQAGREILERYQEMEAAYEAWRKQPESITKGIEFAHRTADALASLNVLFGAMPEPPRDYFQGLLESVPAYVHALTSLLRARLQRIDQTLAVASGDVPLWENRENTPVCSSGRVGREGAVIIRGLNVDDGTKRHIFRAACHSGLGAALRDYLA